MPQTYRKHGLFVEDVNRYYILLTVNQKKNNQTALVKDIASATVESISENVNTSGIGRPHDI